MSDHSISSKQLLAGALLGAFIGAAGATLVTTSTGKKLKRDAKAKYHEIRDTVSDLVDYCQKSISNNVPSQTDEWANKAREIFENMKGCVHNLSDHTELGAGLLIGGVLGAGAALIIHKQFCVNDEGVLNKIGAQISNWKPIISEWHRFMDTSCKPCAVNAPINNRVNDVFDFAVAGLKLWNKMKNN